VHGTAVAARIAMASNEARRRLQQRMAASVATQNRKVTPIAGPLKLIDWIGVPFPKS
jgi:hypothetical protein